MVMELSVNSHTNRKRAKPEKLTESASSLILLAPFSAHLTFAQFHGLETTRGRPPRSR